MSAIPRLSIDLAPFEGGIITWGKYQAVSKGCLDTFSELRELGDMIEVFRVTWLMLDPPSPGPRFEIHFHDPIGNKMSYTTDYRFMGSKKPDLTAGEITLNMCSKGGLMGSISEHIKKCEERVLRAQQQIKALSRMTKST